jgi:hypothetical protein
MTERAAWRSLELSLLPPNKLLAHVCTFGLELIENKASSSSMCH